MIKNAKLSSETEANFIFQLIGANKSTKVLVRMITISKENASTFLSEIDKNEKANFTEDKLVCGLKEICEENGTVQEGFMIEDVEKVMKQLKSCADTSPGTSRTMLGSARHRNDQKRNNRVCYGCKKRENISTNNPECYRSMKKCKGISVKTENAFNEQQKIQKIQPQRTTTTMVRKRRRSLKRSVGRNRFSG